MAKLDKSLVVDRTAGRNFLGIDFRFGKYDLVEVDGIFGLISNLDRKIGKGGYRVFPVDLNKDKHVCKIQSSGKSTYGDYFITRYLVPFDDKGCYEPSGTTHYLGKRMSLAAFELASEKVFTDAWKAFKRANPDMGTNYENSLVGKFEGFLDASDSLVNKAGEKLEALKQKGRNINIDSIDGIIPGFRATVEKAGVKADAWLTKVDESMDAFLDKVEDRHLMFVSENTKSNDKDQSLEACFQDEVGVNRLIKKAEERAEECDSEGSLESDLDRGMEI